MHRRLGLGILATVSAMALGATVAQAGVITGAIDNNKLVTLTNNTRSDGLTTFATGSRPVLGSPKDDPERASDGPEAAPG